MPAKRARLAIACAGATPTWRAAAIAARALARLWRPASGIGPLIALPGVVGFAWAGWGADGLPPLSLGFVNLLALVIVAPVSVYAAPYGVRVAHSISRRALELAFAAFLASVSIRFLIDLLW